MVMMVCRVCASLVEDAFVHLQYRPQQPHHRWLHPRTSHLLVFFADADHGETNVALLNHHYH